MRGGIIRFIGFIRRGISSGSVSSCGISRWGRGGILILGLVMSNPHLHIEVDMGVPVISCVFDISSIKNI